MKLHLNYRSLINNLLLISLFLVVAHSKLIAQEKQLLKNNLADFKISIEKIGDDIKLRCEKGCAWKELAFDKRYQSQEINTYGMVELNENSSNIDESLADFLFTVKRTERGVELRGIRGTAWTELIFSLHDNTQQTINQTGMVKQK